MDKSLKVLKIEYFTFKDESVGTTVVYKAIEPIETLPGIKNFKDFSRSELHKFLLDHFKDLMYDCNFRVMELVEVENKA
jgi:hypothetical protein